LQILLTTNSTALRKQILSKSEETRLEKILELARTLELVESQTNTIENKTEINAIKTASTSQSCQFCGLEHPIKKCPAYGKRCNKCNGLNHYARCCKTESTKKANTSRVNTIVSRELLDEDKDWF
jgi:hypothetical protein